MFQTDAINLTPSTLPTVVQCRAVNYNYGYIHKYIKTKQPGMEKLCSKMCEIKIKNVFFHEFYSFNQLKLKFNILQRIKHKLLLLLFMLQCNVCTMYNVGR